MTSLFEMVENGIQARFEKLELGIGIKFGQISAELDRMMGLIERMEERINDIEDKEGS